MLNWEDREYVNPRKKVFKNLDTDEILNLELQDDPDNISKESQTPLTAHNLNQAQQELIDDLGKDYTGTNITAPTVEGYGRIKKLSGVAINDVNLFNINWINTTLPTSIGFLLTDKGIKLSTGDYCLWIKLEDGTMLNNSDMAMSFWNGDTRVLTLGAGDTANITQDQANIISSFRLYFANTSYAGKKIKEIKLHKGSVPMPYSPYGYVSVEVISRKGDETSSNVCFVKDGLNEADYIDYALGKVYRANGTVQDIEGSDKIVQYPDSTTIHNRDGAEIEVELTNNHTVSGLNEVDKVLDKKIEEVKAKHEEMNTYSTEEQVVGTWIDGKPLYRKVVNFGTLPNNTLKSIGTGLVADQQTIVNINGVFNAKISGVERTYSLNSARISSLRTTYGGKYIEIETISDLSEYSAYVVLEYTKTTD